MSEKLTLTVTGMTCGGCENAITRMLSMLDGVKDASASHKDAQVRVTYDPARVDRGRITRAIASAGYAVTT